HPSQLLKPFSIPRSRNKKMLRIYSKSIMAFVGHEFTQKLQPMHFWSSIFTSQSSSMHMAFTGHSERHAPQSTHLSLSFLTTLMAGCTSIPASSINLIPFPSSGPLISTSILPPRGVMLALRMLKSMSYFFMASEIIDLLTILGENLSHAFILTLPCSLSFQ